MGLARRELEKIDGRINFPRQNLTDQKMKPPKLMLTSDGRNF